MTLIVSNFLPNRSLMEKEDIIILKVIREFLQDLTLLGVAQIPSQAYIEGMHEPIHQKMIEIIEENKQLQEKIVAQAKMFTLTVSHLEKENEQLKNNSKNVAKQDSNEQNTNPKLQKEIAQLKQQLATANGQAQELNELKKIATQHQTQTQEIAQLKRQLATANGQAQELNELKKIATQHQTQTQEIAQLKQQLATANGQAQELNELKKIVEQYKTQTQELSQLKQQLATANSQTQEISSIKQKNTDLQNQNQTLSKEKEELQHIIAEQRQVTQQQKENFESMLISQQQFAQKERETMEQILAEYKNNNTAVDWDILRQNIFCSQKDLEKAITQSYYWQPEKQHNSFFWVGEKMGLNYLAVVNCGNTSQQSSTLTLTLNFLLNHIILENKISIDIERIIERLHFRIEELYKSEAISQEQEIKIALCVIDSLNTTLYFAGFGFNLMVQRADNFQIISGQDWKLGKNSHKVKINKTIMPIRKGTNFFLPAFYQESVEKNNFIETLQTQLEKQKHLPFNEQKENLENLTEIQKNNLDDFILLSFRI
ncbi:MAG: hypothetical protein EAZ55_03725 [Cytophagales bacterium]|nr:MAG: hypothetical protein EAZ55_03725 [Cytophagales bacterium]